MRSWHKLSRHIWIWKLISLWCLLSMISYHGLSTKPRNFSASSHWLGSQATTELPFIHWFWRSHRSCAQTGNSRINLLTKICAFFNSNLPHSPLRRLLPAALAICLHTLISGSLFWALRMISPLSWWNYYKDRLKGMQFKKLQICRSRFSNKEWHLNPFDSIAEINSPKAAWSNPMVANISLPDQISQSYQLVRGICLNWPFALVLNRL